MKYLNLSGLSYFTNKIKSALAEALDGKSDVGHTHTKSEITDLPSGLTVDSTLDGTSSNAIANSAVKNALDDKADKATTLSGYGITDAYTKTEVNTKISNLVNSAPETLDTLNELASVLGNDPNFATTVANQIGTKANNSDVVHKSGNETITGTKTFSSNIVGNLKGNADTATKSTTADSATNCPNYLPLSGGYLTSFFVGRNVDNSFLHLSSCTDYIKGAMLIMYGEGSSDLPGSFRLIARNSSTMYELDGKPNGLLTWNGKNIVRSVNGINADANGNVVIVSGPSVKTSDNNHNILFDWGSQVSGYVGLKVDNTNMGGIVTTDKLPTLVSCFNPTSGDYNEGIRFNKSPNGWAMITIGTARNTTKGSMNGTGWGIFCDTSDNLVISNFDSDTGNAALYCSDKNTYIANLHISGGYKIYVG